MKFLIFITTILVCSPSFAIMKKMVAAPSSNIGGLYVLEGLIAFQAKFDNTSNSVTDKTFASSETSLGYILSDWLYLGGVFNYTVLKEKTSDSSSNVISHDGTLQYYGPSLGYMGETWFLIGHYFAAAEQKDSVSGDTISSYTTNRSGAGYGFNLGYKVVTSTFIELAPMIAYKSITYTNCKDPNTGVTGNCSSSITQSEVTPYLTILFNFK